MGVVNVTFGERNADQQRNSFGHLGPFSAGSAPLDGAPVIIRLDERTCCDPSSSVFAPPLPVTVSSVWRSPGWSGLRVVPVSVELVSRSRRSPLAACHAEPPTLH